MPIWMLVEDEPDMREVLFAMLEIWGVDGIAFVDGVEAIDWIESIDEKRKIETLPDLALLDIRLPRLSGIEVSARLRRSRLLHEIPILLMTAYRLTPFERGQVLQLSQANNIVYKPLPSMEQFRAILNGLVTTQHKFDT